MNIKLRPHMHKMSTYKRKHAKRNYQRKVFGIADNGVLTLEGLILLIDNVCKLREGK
jgi:hypothetical protein